MNLYGFAGGDPVNFSDPFGLSPCEHPPCRSSDDGMDGAPLPPGIDPDKVTWDPKGKRYTNDDDGTLIIPSPEDPGHWKHWDVVPKGSGGKQYRWPEKVLKPWPGQTRGLKPNQSPTPPSWDPLKSIRDFFNSPVPSWFPNIPPLFPMGGTPLLPPLPIPIVP